MANDCFHNSSLETSNCYFRHHVVGAELLVDMVIRSKLTTRGIFRYLKAAVAGGQSRARMYRAEGPLERYEYHAS
jgi:hypothetical protein